jgi:hypothetical protein
MSFGTVQAEKMTTESGYSLGAGNSTSFKNRIINGEMDIDQRNAGASYAQINAGYSLDRWLGYSYAGSAVTGKYTVQQNAGSVTPPTGFTKYLGVTSSTATADASTNIYGIAQRIEGFNVSDLGWGTANAKTVTLSFWVRSSLTGTFGGSIQNNAQDRSFPFSYSISSANTWEQKTITIVGDTSGTWLTNNSVGVLVNFGIGVGSTFSGTANAWVAANYYSTTGATSVVGTNGATFYITGVQLEVGTVATSFDFRSIGTELALCQRYYEKTYAIGTVPGTATSKNNRVAFGLLSSPTTTSYIVDSCGYKVQKRADPTVVFYDQGGNSGKITSLVIGSTNANNQTALLSAESGDYNLVVVRDTGMTAANGLAWHFTASAEL